MKETRRPSAAAPRDSAAQLREALAHHQRGDPRTAEIMYREVLEVEADSFDAMHLLGVALTQRGAYAEGICKLQRAIALDGTQANARFSLARALLETHDSSAALDACDTLVTMQPQSAEAWMLHGNAQQQSGAHDRAIDSYDRALQIDASLPAVLNNWGHSLRVLRRTDRALAAFARALELQPAYVMALNNQGLALLDLQQFPDALRSFDHALSFQPNSLDVLSNKGTTLVALKRFVEAASCFARLVELSPQFGGAVGSLFYARRNCCDWSGYEELETSVIAAVQRGEFADLPLSFLCVSDLPAVQLACAQTFSSTRYPARHTPPIVRPRHAQRGPNPGGRIRVAYLSGDFGEHAASYLLAGVIERHDRSRFDTIAVAWGRRAESPMRTRLESAFGHFIDATVLSDAQIVSRLRDLQVDIAIDLSGHTGAQRTDVFTGRAAPIQVNYLGFPATMGMTAIDYILADEFLIPPEHRESYRECIVYLPDCFQANDDRRGIDVPGPTRADLGLPDGAFVWCSFHGSYKLNPAMFDIWARLTRAVPGSVFWLLGGNPAVEANLRREADARGLDARRLVFATHVPYSRHLARLGLADLCLDTLPFNGGATTSDALWAGVPVVTCSGRSFAARMSGSLLHALGMPELVTNSLLDYEQLALQLAREPVRLAELRVQLAARSIISPLFDSARFCRHLEAAYSAMMERHTQGLTPATLWV